MKPERAWVRLESGRRLNLLQPDPNGWTDRDLAIGLSRTYRWGGHSRWDLPLSVAQHSLLVLVLRQKMGQFDHLTRGEAKLRIHPYQRVPEVLTSETRQAILETAAVLRKHLHYKKRLMPTKSVVADFLLVV